MYRWFFITTTSIMNKIKVKQMQQIAIKLHCTESLVMCCICVPPLVLLFVFVRNNLRVSKNFVNERR